jgi:hypothetical protein
MNLFIHRLYRVHRTCAGGVKGAPVAQWFFYPSTSAGADDIHFTCE